MFEYQQNFPCIIDGGVTFHPAVDIPLRIPVYPRHGIGPHDDLNSIG